MGDNCAKVLACMKAHQGDAGIARWGTQAVGRLLHQALFGGDQELEACQIKLADGGACQIMVGAMNDHADKADVQMHGTTALLYLSVGNGRNCRALGEAGACEALMAAVRRFTAGVAWQQDAAGAIASLGAVPSHVEVLVAGGACTFVLAVLQANLHDARTMSMALPAVGVLSRQYAIDLIANGACKTVAQALNAHLDNSHIQLKGLSALVHLARVDAARLSLSGECRRRRSSGQNNARISRRLTAPAPGCSNHRICVVRQRSVRGTADAHGWLRAGHSSAQHLPEPRRCQQPRARCAPPFWRRRYSRPGRRGSVRSGWSLAQRMPRRRGRQCSCALALASLARAATPHCA